MTLPKLSARCTRPLEVSCMILMLVAASNYFGAVFSRLGSREYDRRVDAGAAVFRQR